MKTEKTERQNDLRKWLIGFYLFVGPILIGEWTSGYSRLGNERADLARKLLVGD